MYYSGGKLIEDATQQFLLTAEGTLAPCPVSFNEVKTVEELRHTVQNHSITHARAAHRSDLWSRALRWDNQFDYMPVYVAPMSLEVRGWGRTLLRSSPVDPPDPADDTSYGAPNRVMNLGAARFVTNRAVSPVAVSAYSPNGLRSVEIYVTTQAILLGSIKRRNVLGVFDRSRRDHRTANDSIDDSGRCIRRIPSTERSCSTALCSGILSWL